MAKEKKLTKSEHLEMELNQEQVLNAKLEMELEVSKKNEVILQARIKQLESEKLLRAKTDLVNNKRQKLTTIEEEHRVFVEKMKAKYKIKGAFGIDPDTGIIQED
jgi:predicted dithiol-disulfide oxidoreductase (DUF899 family)